MKVRLAGEVVERAGLADEGNFASLLVKEGEERDSAGAAGCCASFLAWKYVSFTGLTGVKGLAGSFTAGGDTSRAEVISGGDVERARGGGASAGSFRINPERFANL